MPTDSSTPASSAMVHGGEHLVAGGVSQWTMPPMPAWMPMMPGMTGLVPSTRPFLPREAGQVTSGPAVVRLRSGDTMVLNAGRITRAIGGREVTLYGFNGRSPGPRLESSGRERECRARNSIDQPTAIHWHGVPRQSVRRNGDHAAGHRGRIVLPRIISGFQTPGCFGITHTCGKTFSRRSASTATSPCDPRTPRTMARRTAKSS
jgi:hypothetical protein